MNCGYITAIAQKKRRQPSIIFPVSLSKVVFDGGYIPSGALSNCIYIKDIIVEEGVSGIGEGAFSGCSSLECIELSFIGNRPQIKENDEWQYPIGYLFGKDSYDGGVETQHITMLII